MKNILITGASGFIGKSLLTCLSEENFQITATYNNTFNKTGQLYENVKWKKFDLLDIDDTYTEMFKNIDIVIHLAGLAHFKGKDDPDYINKINAIGTEKLAECASVAGVKIFIYVSTIKVHGEKSDNIKNKENYINENSTVKSSDPYAQSKIEAEKSIKNICKNSGMKYIILRPSLVYGPEVKGNIYYLVKFLKKFRILPFGSIKNKRSFLYVENFCDVIRKCMDCELALNQTFLVSDIELSTINLIKLISKHLNIRVVIFPFPVWILRFICVLFRKQEMFDKISTSLLVDTNKLKSHLNWTPKYSLDYGMKKTVNSFLHAA